MNNKYYKQKQQVEFDFDIISNDYDLLKRSLSYDNIIIEKIKSLFQGLPFDLIEIGCATGNLINEFISNNDRKDLIIGSIYAVDISKSMIDRAKKKVTNTNNVVFLNLNGTELTKTIDGKKFDLLVSKFVLHDYPDPNILLNEWAKLLKPNGYIIIVDRYRYKYRARRFISYVKMELWLIKKFRELTGSYFRTIKWIFDDLRVWHSKEWRQHRKHEKIMQYSKAKIIYNSILKVIVFKKMNDRSFLLIGQKNDYST